MHSIQIHKVIGSIISLFYLIGVWHHGDKPTVKEMRLKLFYCIYHLLCVLSIAFGAIINENSDVSILLAEVSIAHAVLGVKIWLLIWKQHQILSLLDRICVLTIRNDDASKLFTDKLGGFMKFVFFFLITATVAGCSDCVVLSFVETEKVLFLEIAFPLDYKNSEFGFWVATVFIFTAFLMAMIGILFSVIIWYFLLICSLRFEVLGNDLKIMARRSEAKKGKLNEIQMHTDFLEDLEESVGDHVHITELKSELESFLARIFFVQFSISQTKKDIIIFGEYLKQPKQLLVGKLYPLTLETFRRILNSAYSMFNILKSFQQ